MPELTRITGNVIANGTITNDDISLSTIIDRAKLQLSSPAGVKTVYLAPRTDGIAGSGTELDPYDVGGATEQLAADKYDAVIKNRTKCPDFCTIRLLAGNYFTRGANPYQPGRPNSSFNQAYWTDYPLACSVIGDGMNSTIIKVVQNPGPMDPYWKYQAITIFAEVVGSPVNSLEFYSQPSVVSDLCIDGNWQVLRKAFSSVNGVVNHSGTMSLIKNVWIKNFGGDWNTGAESFGIVAVSPKISIVDGCVSTNEVDSWDGGDPYISNISAAGAFRNYPAVPPFNLPYVMAEGTAIVKNCLVVSGTTLNPRTSASGVGSFADKLTIVENNVVYNKQGGTYRDTGINNCNIIRNNTYYNCQFGIHGNFDVNSQGFFASHDKQWIIKNNIFYIPDDSQIAYYGPARITWSEKIDYTNNTIRCINPSATHNNSSTRIGAVKFINYDNNIRETENAGRLELVTISGTANIGDDYSLLGNKYKLSFVPQIWEQNGNGVNPNLISITRSGSIATATILNPSQSSFPKYLTDYNPIVRITGANIAEYNGVKEITITSNTTFTFAVNGTPANPTGTIVFRFANYSCNKDFYIRNNHVDPFENGEQLKDALEYAAQIPIYDNKVDYITNIYLSPGLYKLRNATSVFFGGKFNVIGMGNPEDVIIDFGTQIVNAGVGTGFNSIGDTSNNRFGFKNCTITGSKSSAASVSSSLMNFTANNFENTFENVVFDKGTHDIITATLVGRFKNCKFNGAVNILSSLANSTAKGYFESCTFELSGFAGFQDNTITNTFKNCNFILNTGSINENLYLEGNIENCSFICTRSSSALLVLSEFYFTSLKNSKLENLQLKISVGSNLPANPALRAECLDVQIILPTGVTPSIFSQNANTNVRVANLSSNGTAPLKDANTVIQTLTQIS